MDEFASARLVGVVRRGLAVAGIETTAPPARGALLPLSAKRRYLAGIAREHGLLPLLRVGAVLPELAADPAVSALSRTDSPADLVERWRRLERFTHSRHRVEVAGRGVDELDLTHVGPPGSPPEPAEDAVVLGVLVALLGLIGVRGVGVTAGEVEVCVSGEFVAPLPESGSARWHVTWTSTAAPDPVILGEQDVVAAARGLLGADLARRWTVDELAGRLGTSRRGLQRRLREAGGFQDMLGTARTEAAAGLLLGGAHSLSTIGFACGYTDQPHFTRDFTRRTAMTPSAYRGAFGASHKIKPR
ncbi:helix-turn-helix transcriptional regulator [Actinokineospora diospyrosa]|uniref:AraC-type DNA-binding protein n=1 Tax=Actinokineospora diospyrosa TaxID=103728 RepID=A0ABT1I9S1_9PSEU|nr:AraC family transcriptional regulator [Actinokineospora diospyrosa]MCP2269383.1 AraC-type DNA-binding protein [Actinokineospora diospyrosa]